MLSPDIASILMIVGIFAIMYFLVIRPQNQRLNQQNDFIQNIKKGDKIVTIGGIHGKVVKTDEHSLLLEVDPNTRLRIDRTAASFEFSKSLKGNKQPNTVES